ncbi:Nucleoporin complex subunit 54 [Leishmania braziliensis]|nr:Nucleoporin complex subunit 54 [Leishmania braziliensis]
MFGATAPSTVIGAPAAGFGKAPATFGTTTLTGTNTTAPTGSGFGSKTGTSTTPGFGTAFAAPMSSAAPVFSATPAGGAAGFGSGSASGTTAPGGAAGVGTCGFGAGGGFGAKSGGGFGTHATSGFGAPATAGIGFGSGAAAPAATGGWGMQQPNPTMQPQAPQQQQATVHLLQPTVTLQDFTRQSALASYLVKLDESYNALHPNCHFRAFVYNTCGAGQAMDAIQKERYTAYLNGGGCSDEAYMQALQKSPDPGRLYPSPIHFSQELRRRTEKQREAVKVLQRKAAELLQDVDTVAGMDAANVRRQREVEQQEVMLLHRWYSLLCKMELLRRHGSSYGEESLLNSRVEQLRQLLRAPGRYSQLLGELRPFLTEEASRVAMVAQQSANKSEARQQQPGFIGAAPAVWRSADGQPLLRSEVDPYMMRDWIQFTKQMQDGIEALDELLKTDLKEMQAIRSRVEAS